jgi:putative tricarboxylic transport membrane protein
MLIAQGNIGVFWSNWLVGSLTTLALVLLFWPLIGALRAWLRAEPKARRASV